MNLFSIPNLLIICCLATIGCKTGASSATTKIEPKTPVPTASQYSVVDILKKVEKNNLSFGRLSADADMDYEGKPMNVSASSLVRFRKDSLIWMNVKKMGFNVVRAQITRDSIFVINYIQSNFMRRSFKYLEEKLQVPANFDMVQKMLLGQPIFLTPKDQLKVSFDKTIAGGQWVLTGDDARWHTEYRFSAIDFTLQNMILEQPARKSVFKMACNNYDGLKGDQKFAYTRTLNMESPQTGAVKVVIETGKPVEVDVVKPFRFEIPANYPEL
ncbi:MAG: hypothetical protein RL329_95 [Bacteroidota bacterium]